MYHPRKTTPLYSYNSDPGILGPNPGLPGTNKGCQYFFQAGLPNFFDMIISGTLFWIIPESLSHVAQTIWLGVKIDLNPSILNLHPLAK